MNTSGALLVRGLTCRYGRVVAVDRVDLEIGDGEHVAVMGANGSGKSTMLRSIGGLQRADAGTVSLGGEVVAGRDARSRCAWVPQRQSAGRFPLRLSELLDSSGDPASARRTAAALMIDDILRRPLSTLSGGQLQRAFLARAIGSITAGARMLLADEPTAALDFDGQAEIARLLRDLPVTLVVVTHDRAVADVCHRTFEMAAGRLREVA